MSMLEKLQSLDESYTLSIEAQRQDAVQNLVKRLAEVQPWNNEGTSGDLDENVEIAKKIIKCIQDEGYDIDWGKYSLAKVMQEAKDNSSKFMATIRKCTVKDVN